jgi:hypothetical protein
MRYVLMISSDFFLKKSAPNRLFLTGDWSVCEASYCHNFRIGHAIIRLPIERDFSFQAHSTSARAGRLTRFSVRHTQATYGPGIRRDMQLNASSHTKPIKPIPLPLNRGLNKKGIWCTLYFRTHMHMNLKSSLKMLKNHTYYFAPSSFMYKILSSKS